MVKAVIPNHKQIMGFGKETAVIADTNKPTNHVHDEKDTEDLLNSIVSKAAENPPEIKMFFKHKFVARKCACGMALGFKIAPMLSFIGVVDVETKGDVLRSFIKCKGIGCNGVKFRFVWDDP
ncbi:uncharacterized protein LOC144650157 [Oculina patagonica]